MPRVKQDQYAQAEDTEMADANSTAVSPYSADIMAPQSSQDNIPYSADFTDNLMDTVLQTGLISTGTTIIPNNPPKEPKGNDNSIRLSSISPAALPNFHSTDLPLPLTDSRRIYQSPIKNVQVSHPGGWIEGGAGPAPLPLDLATLDTADAETAEFAHEFLERNNPRTYAEFQRRIDAEVKANVEELKRQMRERREAIEENRRMLRELEQLEAQRAMERRVEERMREETRKRREGAV